MKKFFITLSACFAVLALSFSSCKDDEKETEEPINNTITETEIIKIVKHPTKEELQKNNYTAAGKYFDFKNMKAYSVDFNDENKYTFVSDVTFNEENSTLTFEDEYSTYNYVLYFVGEELYRRTGIF